MKYIIEKISEKEYLTLLIDIQQQFNIDAIDSISMRKRIEFICESERIEADLASRGLSEDDFLSVILQHMEKNNTFE